MNRLEDGFPSRKTAKRIRRMYPAGTRVELISVNAPYTELKPGDRGIVMLVDSVGTVFIVWDCGPVCGIAYGSARIHKLTYG